MSTYTKYDNGNVCVNDSVMKNITIPPRGAQRTNNILY